MSLFRDRLIALELPYISAAGRGTGAMLTWARFALVQGGHAFECSVPNCVREPTAVDHDHVTGFVRDVVCHNHNAVRTRDYDRRGQLALSASDGA